jgi:hypothetical protein
MGKKGHNRKLKEKQAKQQISFLQKQNTELANNMQKEKRPENHRDKPNILREYIWPIIICICITIITTYGGNILNNILSPSGYFVFIFSICIVLGYWTWRIVNSHKLQKTPIFRGISVRIISVASIIFIIIISSQYWMGFFIKDEGNNKMPDLANASTDVTVILGKEGGMYCRLSDFDNNSFPFSNTIVFGSKEKDYKPFNIYRDNDQILINTQLYNGNNRSPIEIKNKL